jgi:hypothetical protein
MRRLMRRLKAHEPELHAQAAAVLKSGTMPALLYSADSLLVNPALLCCLHAKRTYRSPATVYLPVRSRASTFEGDHLSVAVPSTTNTDDVVQQLGEVWWLFDAEQPYLVEVFTDGKIPSSRLPHLDRAAFRGKHAARVLGSTRLETKTVSKKAHHVLFTPWYARHACV